MTRPVFKPHMRVNVIPGEGVLVWSEEKISALHGRVYELLAPLIDGTRNADELVDALAGQVEGAKVYYALAMLEQNGHVADNSPEIADQTAAFWHGMGIDPRVAIQALGSKRLSVRAVGEADASPLLAALTDLGAIFHEGGSGDLEAVVTDDYLRAELNTLNAAALQEERPWFLVKPFGHEPWIGPLFVPGKTGCYRCLATRLARNRPVLRFVQETNQVQALSSATPAGTTASINAICQLAAVEIVKFLAGAKEGLEGRVLTLDLRTWDTAIHDLSKLPNCKACGAKTAASAVPVELVSRKVTFEDCGHRTEPPETTLRRYQHLVSPITGVVTMLAPVYGVDGLVHVYMAGHNHALKLERLDSLKASLRNCSSGKGVSATQAKASALCEAIERYSGEGNGNEWIVTASFREMQERFGGDAIHPNKVMLFSAWQLAEHESWNRKRSKFNRVPEALDESAPIDWTPVWSLTHARHRYLPTQLLYYRMRASAARENFYCVACSNGSAAGNNLEEAVVQGFCELVERDAVALWWYNRLRRPGVAVESFDEPWLLALAVHYGTLGRDVWALDLTADLGIPVFIAASRLRNAPEERILFGLGCHLDARLALQRAFAEMNQMLGLADGLERGCFTVEDEETLRWLKTATLANQPYLVPDEKSPLRQLGDYPSLCTGDLLEDIRLCRRAVEERDMEVMVLDQTQADVGMPVVKVIVPGLRHFWARFAPGRLYDIPVQMGWMEKPLPEEELNPIPVFI